MLLIFEISELYCAHELLLPQERAQDVARIAGEDLFQVRVLVPRKLIFVLLEPKIRLIWRKQIDDIVHDVPF